MRNLPASTSPAESLLGEDSGVAEALPGEGVERNGFSLIVLREKPLHLGAHARVRAALLQK
jgi:hypothetical protein